MKARKQTMQEKQNICIDCKQTIQKDDWFSTIRCSNCLIEWLKP